MFLVGVRFFFFFLFSLELFFFLFDVFFFCFSCASGFFVSLRSSKEWRRLIAALVPAGCYVGFMIFVWCELFFAAVHSRHALLLFGVQHGSGGDGGNVTTCMKLLAQGMPGHAQNFVQDIFGTLSGHVWEISNEGMLITLFRTLSGHDRERGVAGLF